MQLPIVAPAPMVTEHAAAFRDLFENACRSLKSGQGSEDRVGSWYERATHNTHGTGG